MKICTRARSVFRYPARVLSSGVSALFLMVSVLAPSVAYSGDCVVQQTTSSAVGRKRGNDTYTFSGLEAIDRIVSYQEANGNGISCTNDSFFFSGNRLTVTNSLLSLTTCKAFVTVEGKEAGCVPDEAADSDIVQQPLFLSQAAPPNVMYILDDSGSMQWELLPNDIMFEETRYVYPRADGIYGAGDYSNRVPTVDDKDPYNARSRSPQINTLYYDPSVTYRPWIDGDGNLLANANPVCAPHNPFFEVTLQSLLYCRSLVTLNSNFNNNDWYSCAADGSCTKTGDVKSFWPATYFWYRGVGDLWDWNSYQQVQIRPGLDYSGHGRSSRDDCADAANATCTYAEEIQNFANWYTYYRSRAATARAGSGFAFAEQGKGIRVGFGTLNSGDNDIDGVTSKVILQGVREFSGDSRRAFFSSLYNSPIPTDGTPLRRALDYGGRYYSRSDNLGPWSATPGEDKGDDQKACRRNYTVLMTDGYWNGGDPGGDADDNNDGTNGPSHTSSTGETYTYSAVSPFTDGWDKTLADVAMYYWKNDLRSDLPNVVTPTSSNPAFWQHMSTFSIGLGVTGSVDADAAFAAVKTGDSITWPNPKDADPNKVDDLLHAAVNGRGGFFSADNPDAFANQLSDTLQTIATESKSSASSIAANSTRLDSETIVYQASFNSADWSGRLVAYKLEGDGDISTVVWDTDKTLTSDVGRNVFTSVGQPGLSTSQAVNFNLTNWGLLHDDQKAALNAGGTDLDGQLLLSWLRGSRVQEGLKFRTRSVLLGDIVNSDPVFIGRDDDYGFQVLGGAEGGSYKAFLNTKSGWSSLVVVGANDGMLHGFNDATGKELFAFIPAGVYGKLSGIAAPDYQHVYSVDGSARASDAYINSQWKTVVVGSTGAGGRSVFALDVSDPTSIGKNDLLWEFATASTDSDRLGVAMSNPTIARLDAGDKWVAIFGNGYDSGDNVKLFIVDLATGQLIKAIDTGVSGVGNGLASPVPVDVDSDRITDFIYAGDLKGNLWKFDVRGTSVAGWDVALKSGSDPQPLFTALDDNGVAQPITSRPVVGNHDDGGYYVYFGTGSYFRSGDRGADVGSQVQDFYGIRDLDVQVARSNLLVQDIIYEAVGSTKDGKTTEFQVRLVTANGADAVPEFGWRLPLLPPDDTAEGERVVSRPILRNGKVIFASLIPSDDVCGFGGRGWLMEIDAQTGGRYHDPVLDTNSDGVLDAFDMVLYDGEYLPISGRGSDEIIKTPGVVSKGDVEFKYTSGSSGSIGVIAEKGEDDGLLGRQSWRQLQ